MITISVRTALTAVILILFSTLRNYGQSFKDLAERHLKSGINKYQNKDYSGAAADFEKAIKENSIDYRGYGWKGKSLEELARYLEAIPLYTQALKLNKNDTISYRGRADSRRMIHEYEASITDYDKAILLKPKDLGALYGRATSLFELERYDESIRDCSSFLQRNKNNSLVYFLRSAAYAANHQYGPAKEDIKKYFQLGGRVDAAYYYRGLVNIFLSRGNVPMLDSAIRDLVRYTNSNEEANRNDYSGHQLLGVAYAKVGDSTNSRRSFKKSLELNPQSMNTYARWGSSEVGFGNYKKGDELLSIGYKMLNSPDGVSSDFYYNFAIAKVGLNDTVAAVDFFEKSIKADSNNRDAYEARLAFIYTNPKYKAAILRDLMQLVRLTFIDDEKAEWYSMRSLIYFGAGNLDSAMNEVNKAIRLMPEEPLHYMIRASVNAMANQSAEAVLSDIDEAIRLDSSLPEPYMLKASYFAVRKDFKHGCEALKRALELGTTVPKDVSDYICKGKLPKSGKTPQLFVPLMPMFDKKH